VASHETVRGDEATQVEVLSSLLRRHPGALVSAIEASGLFVDLPATIELLGQQLAHAVSALALVEPAYRNAIITAWDQANAVGAATVPVVLANGIGAHYHFVDVRAQHGVLVGVIVADDAQVDLASSFSGHMAVMPKSGRIEKDAQAVIVSADDRICRMLGYQPGELIGTRSLALLHPEDRDSAVDSWMEMLSAPAGSSRLRARHERKDGSWLWLELTNTNRLAEAEGRVVTEMIDISDEMAALEALRQREQLLVRLAEALPSGILHVDRERNIVYANARLHHVVGVGRSATVDHQLATVIPEDRAALAAALHVTLVDGRDIDFEVRVRMPGEADLRLCAIASRALTDAGGTPAGAVLCVDDVTEASGLRAELERRATIDELTGCLNRAAVLDALDDRLRRHAATASGTAVVFLDLDGFKEVNDTFGHKAGDRLLAGAASRLRRAMREGDVIGRLGGDEFIVVLADVNSSQEAMRIGFRLRETLAEPVDVVHGMPIRIRSSIGVAWANGDAVDGDTLTAAADHAMYESKRAGAGEPVLANT
jgi:diguanylate cyclase (GGDEF)-like protein/PAS domain S-box-containing protein